jgi:pteridine reductase
MKDTLLPLSGKTALITGAARRIGAALAKTLHGAGMNILLHYRSSGAEAKRLCDGLNRRREGSAVMMAAELLDKREIDALIEEAAGTWKRLDVLINNASSFYNSPLGEISLEQWDELVGTNLKAPLFLSQAAAPYLRTQKGCIVNIVDIHADRPLKNYTLYSVAKAGLVMLTKSLARELAPEVRSNGIAPGAILWPEVDDYASVQQEIIERTALKRQGNPDDIARAALFLVRDAAYITGQIITVDGGRTLSN